MPALFAHASWLPAFFTSARSKQTISFDSRTRMLCSQRRQSDQPFGFGWLPRISRNSRGPLMRRRFRSCRSSAVADGSPILSIRRPAMSEAFAAAFRLVCFAGSEPTSPSSTRRRMASEREAALLRAAHRSIACVSSTDKRIAETGACPMAGRPLFFRFTGIENFMIYLYYKKESRARCGPTCGAITPDIGGESTMHKSIIVELGAHGESGKTPRGRLGQGRYPRAVRVK
jgi:hypothetical protein